MPMRLALIDLSARTMCACTTAPKNWNKSTAVSSDIERDKASTACAAKRLSNLCRVYARNLYSTHIPIFLLFG